MRIGTVIRVPSAPSLVQRAIALVKGMFAASEQGAWYDPSDFARYAVADGPELVTNGDFGTGNLSGWTNPDTAPSVTAFSSGGAMLTAAAGSASARLRQAINISAGTYEVSLVVSGVTGTPRCNLSLGSGTSGDTAYGSVTILNNGTYRSIITVTGPTLGVAFIASSASGGSIVLDNISVKAVTQISTATLFQDAAGTTPVTAMGQPVGLMLDKRLGLVRGVELIPAPLNLTAGPWATLGVLSATATSMTNTSGAGAGKSIASLMTAGKTYEISCSYTKSDAATILSISTDAGVVILSSTANSGTLSGIFVNATAQLYLRLGGNCTVTINNISVRELPGNHATQPTAINRPVLQARVNLLTKTEDFTDAAWVKGTGMVPSAKEPTGVLSLITMRAGFDSLQQTFTATGPEVTYSVYVKASEDSPTVRSFLLRNTTTLTNFTVGIFTFSTGVVVGDGWGAVHVGDGIYRLSYSRNTGISAGNTLNVYAGGTGNTISTEAGKSYYVGGAQVEAGPVATRYQRVNTATDYDSAGFKTYLTFNGSNQWMSTPAINFTATDKMTVVAGVRKLSDAAEGKLLELSSTTGGFAGSFNIGAPPSAGFAGYYFLSKGSIASAPQLSGFSAPISNVISATGDIAGDAATLRVNGATATSATNQGTGNFGNYPLYIGARAGTSLFFNGQFYGLVIRSALSTTPQIAGAETYMANKTGVTL